MDRVNHSSYVVSVAPSTRGGGCACHQPVSGVGDAFKDNAWVIAAGASAIFLALALMRRKK